MKTLQNNFTTPEQSKRLLELGVPADSADCYYSHYIKTYAHSEYTEILWNRPRFITEDNKPSWNAKLMDGQQTYLPCWSAGRLMEIIAECYQVDMRFRYFVRGGMMESLINTYEDLQHEIDFSILEE